MNRIKPPDTTQGQAPAWYVYAISLVAAVGGFLFGYDLSIISGAIIFLEKAFSLDPATKGFAFSCAILGCVIGPLFGLKLADSVGRRVTLLIAAVCFMVSAIGSALAYGLIDFALWRILGGIGVGLASVTSPMYIAEISPAHLRGRLVTANQLSIVIGINMSVIVSYWLSFGEHWRWMFASEAFPILLLMVGLCFIPRSPRWLAAKNRNDEALNVLTKINGRDKASAELIEIRSELSEETGTFKELLQPGIRFALFCGIVLMVFSQINGVNMMIGYAPSILIEAGIGSPSTAILNTLYVNLLILVATIMAFWVVGKFSRRHILIVGVAFMAFGHLLMGLAFHLDLSPLYNILAMFVGTGSFTLSLAPLGWVILSEIFPNRIRGKAMSAVCCCLYASSFLCAQFFPMITGYLEKTYGNPGGAYWIFTGICVACVIFVWRLLPETKDLTLEEIGRYWLHRGQAK